MIIYYGLKILKIFCFEVLIEKGFKMLMWIRLKGLL